MGLGGWMAHPPASTIVRAMSFRLDDVALPAGTLRVGRAGSGGGTPVVLVHGLSSSHECWARLLPEWDGRPGPVLAPDLPGFGGSDPVGDGYDVARVADALVDGLDALGVARFDLVGHSLGGLVSTVLADRHPDRVGRLVLVAAAGIDPYRGARLSVVGDMADRLMRLRRRLGPGLAGRRRARVLMFASVIDDPEGLSPADAQLLIRCSHGARRTGEALSAALAADLRPLLKRLEAPVGAVWGERDRLIDVAALDELHRVRPGCPVRFVERAAHLPMVERPAAFAEALDGVLGRLPQS